MNSRPIISIITVVLNNEKQIETAINSVLNQEYENVEYIVIDGGSIDNTLSLVENYSSKINHIVSEKDNGIYDAMNKGIKLARGSLIGIVNSDDWLENNIVSQIAEIHSNDPDAIIYGLLKEYKDEMVWRIHTSSHHFIRQRMIPHQTCFIPKKIYERLGLYNTNYKYLADYDFLLRCSTGGEKFVLLEKVISHARTGGATHSNTLAAKEEQAKVLFRHGMLATKMYMQNIVKIRLKRMLAKFA